MDSAKFERLVNQHKAAVYRQMLRVCNHREDAEDALATALLQAFKSANQLTSDEAFRSWLGTIGKRVCTRMRHHAGVQAAFEYADEHQLIDHSQPEMELAILKGCVNDAVAALPPLYRDVYLACELDEKSVPEVAAELGISLSAAKSRLLRARAMVRESLDRSVCQT